MASFRKRGDKWYFRIKAGINPQTGKPTEIQRGGFKTKHAAQVAAAEEQTALERHAFVPISSTTFQEFAAEYHRQLDEALADEKEAAAASSFSGSAKRA